MFGNEWQRKEWLEPLLDGRDPVGVRDDRARRRVLRRHEHLHRDRAGRRRVRDQRPEVVRLRRDEPQLQDLHRDGEDRPEALLAPAAVDGPGAARHPWHARQAGHARVRLLRRRPRRARRDRVRGRQGAGGQPDRRGGRRFRDRPGPARPGPDPPLHAADRDGRAGRRADVRADPVRASRSASRSPSRASSRTGSPSPG